MDRMPRRNTVEKIKNILVVVLSLSAVLLLCFFWQDISVKDLKEFSLDSLSIDSANVAWMPEEKDILVPSKIRVNDGNGSYKVFYADTSECWESESGGGLGDLIKLAMQSNSIVAEEITEEQYIDVMEEPSLVANFEYYLPFNEFCEFISGEKAIGVEQIGDVDEIGFSTLSKDNLFLNINGGEKFYRIVLPENADKMVAYIEEVNKQDADVYFPLDVCLGEELNNKTLIPLQLKSGLKSMEVSKGFDFSDKVELRECAIQFFSETFDFVRKITEESGKTIYMYLYGERVLIADIDGSVEYKSEAENGLASLGYMDAFKLAYNFIQTHGGFTTSNGENVDLYLKSGEYDFDNNGGSRFIFAAEANNMPIVSVDGDALIIEVTKGQVTYFKRNFTYHNPEDVIYSELAPMDAINVIAKNYNEIYDLMNTAGAINGNRENTKDKFKYISQEISRIKYGYFYDSNTLAIPAWIIEYEKNDFEIYIDLYSGEILNYRYK